LSRGNHDGGYLTRTEAAFDATGQARGILQTFRAVFL